MKNMVVFKKLTPFILPGLVCEFLSHHSTTLVKNTLSFSILFFTAFNVHNKFYRHVLTPVNKSQLLSTLDTLDKVRLVTNNIIQLR